MSERQGAKLGKPFVEVAYGYLPLVWGITLAHYLLPLLSEAGQILPVRPTTNSYLSGAQIHMCLHVTTSLFYDASLGSI